MSSPEMSVIIVNWNGKPFLDACLSSLRSQTFQDFETLLVDNGSEDGSVEHVRENYPEVTVLSLDSNRGFQAANVAGYARSQGKLIVLLNNDTEAHPCWLLEIHRASLLFPRAGSFACKMLYFDDRKRIDNCGSWLAPGGFTIDIGRDELDGADYGHYCWVFGGCGGAIAYRRKMLQDVGFFDPDFFMTYDDLDLSFRAQLRGYGCVFVPGAVIYHRYRGTMRRFPGRQVFFSQRNIEYVYLKNMPFALMLRYAPQRLLYELGSAIFFVRQGGALPFLRAKLSLVPILPTILRKRREIQRRRSVGTGQLRALMVDGGIRVKMRKFLSAWRKREADARC